MQHSAMHLGSLPGHNGTVQGGSAAVTAYEAWSAEVFVTFHSTVWSGGFCDLERFRVGLLRRLEVAVQRFFNTRIDWKRTD